MQQGRSLGKLPNAEKAIIEDRKLRDYLLSSTHPTGRYKAYLFQKVGYSAQNWGALEQDLRKLILCRDVTRTKRSEYGQKFEVEGPLTGPNRKTVQVLTVWIILTGETIPRLITAHRGRAEEPLKASLSGLGGEGCQG